MLIEEKNLTPKALELAASDILFTDKGKLFSENIRRFAQPSAKELIYRELLRLSNRDLLTLVAEEEVNE